MKRVLKWIAIIAGALIGIVLVSGLVLYFSAESRLDKTYTYEASNLTIPSDAGSIALGKHRAEALCEGCHGTDLSGLENWFNAPPLGLIDSANLTSGDGGVGAEYTTEDFVRAIRHGVGPDGKPIFMVAVESTSQLSDDELAAIIAYVRSVPAVDHVTREKHFTPLGKILFAVGVLPKMPAEVVSHDIHVEAPSAGVTAEYGEYLVNTHDCRLCHGSELNGGPFPDPTITKISPNLTPGGELAAWTEEQFINTIRTGTTPGGHQLDPKLMPWDFYRKFYDDELKAIWMYLQSLPKLEQYTE